MVLQNVRSVDSVLSDNDDSDDELGLHIRRNRKSDKEKARLLPRYTDRLDSFDSEMNETDI